MIQYLGSKSIADICPALADALNAVASNLNAQIAAKTNDLNSALSLSASLNAALSLPAMPGISAAVLAQLVTPDLSSLGVALSANLADNLTLQNLLAAALAALRLQLDVNAKLIAAIGSPGVHAWSYSGSANVLGSEASGQLAGGVPGGAGPSELVAGLLLVANSGAAISAMQRFLVHA